MINFRDFLPAPPWVGPPIPLFLVRNRVGIEDEGIIPVGTKVGEPEKVHDIPKPIEVPRVVPFPLPPPKVPEEVPEKVLVPIRRR